MRKAELVRGCWDTRQSRLAPLCYPAPARHPAALRRRSTPSWERQQSAGLLPTADFHTAKIVTLGQHDIIAPNPTVAPCQLTVSIFPSWSWYWASKMRVDGEAPTLAISRVALPTSCVEFSKSTGVTLLNQSSTNLTSYVGKLWWHLFYQLHLLPLRSKRHQV